MRTRRRNSVQGNTWCRSLTVSLNCWSGMAIIEVLFVCSVVLLYVYVLHSMANPSQLWRSLGFQKDGDGKIPSVGALRGTLGRGSDRKAAQPKQETAERPTTRVGPTRRFWYQFWWFFLEGGCGRAIDRNPPLCTACCSEPLVSATNKWGRRHIRKSKPKSTRQSVNG